MTSERGAYQAYDWAIRLASAPCPPVLLRLTPRSPEERAAVRDLPAMLSVKFTPPTGAEEGAAASNAQGPAEQRLTLTTRPGFVTPEGAVVMEARVCRKAIITAWMTVFKHKRLCLALDIDDTVLKAFRVSDFEATVEAIRNERDATEAASLAAMKARGEKWRYRLRVLTSYDCLRRALVETRRSVAF